MPTLRELQLGFAATLAGGSADAISGLIIGNPRLAEERLGIHRNTMLAGLRTALALTYPVTAALVGDAFFTQAAHAFIRLHPPAAPLLSLYGAQFTGFLADYAPAQGLAYLPDVARLEWAIEQVAHAPDSDEAPSPFEAALPGVTLTVVPSLALVDTACRAGAIWRAVSDQDEAAIAAIDTGPAQVTLAVWRQGDGVAVADLTPPSAMFLRSLLDGQSPDAALLAAMSSDSEDDPVTAIKRDVFDAGFARLTPADRST
jgi:hypothetical protein